MLVRSLVSHVCVHAITSSHSVILPCTSRSWAICLFCLQAEKAKTSVSQTSPHVSPRNHLLLSVRLPYQEMPEATTTLLLAIERRKRRASRVRLLPLTWASRRLQLAPTSKAESTMLVASKVLAGTISNSTRYAPNAISARRSPTVTST